MNKRILFLISTIYLLFIPEKVNAGCNFKTADYIDQLSSPNQIKAKVLLKVESFWNLSE